MRKLFLISLVLILGILQFTFAECPYENMEDCPYYGQDPYGVVYHTCPYNETDVSDEIDSECKYYSELGGWYKWNGISGNHIKCIDVTYPAINKKITDYFALHLDDALSIVIKPYALETYINSKGEEKPKDENDEWNTTIIRNFKFIEMDGNNNRIKFKCEAYKSKKSERPISKKKIRDYFIYAELTAFLIPKIKDGKLSFDIEVDESNITDAGGWMIALGTVVATSAINPLIQNLAPTIGPLINGVLTTATLPGVMNLLIDMLDDYALKNTPFEAKEIKEFESIWKKVQNYDRYGFLEPSVHVESNGLYLKFNFEYTKYGLIKEEIKNEWDILVGDNTLVTYLDQIQDIAIEKLGRLLNDEELEAVEKYLGFGIDYVKKEITESFEAYEYKYMKGFNLDKFNSNQNMLIVSLAGAGPFNNVMLNENESLIGLETIINNDIPKSVNNYDDQIYQLPFYYTDERTVAVIGYPWLSTAESIKMEEEAYLPNTNRFALKIKEALNRMAPNSKLLLIGKSMGGAQLEEVSHFLNELNVDIDLLVLVDPSSQVTDQSGASYTRAIPTNVKNVYNYRQISAHPYNNEQNGFPISFIAPTKGADIIVGDVNNDIGVLPCEGVGHDDIDECEWVLNEIDRLIAREKGRFDNTSIVNSLLLD